MANFRNENLDLPTRKLLKKAVVGLVGGIVMVLAIFLGIIPFCEYLGKPAYLEILVNPTDAKVKIAGVEYRNAVYEFEPGSYTAEVSTGEAPTEEVTLTLEKNRTTGLYLEWSEEKGKWIYYTAEELEHKNSIGEILPLNLSVCGENATRMNCDAITVEYVDGKLAISGRKAKLDESGLEAVKNGLSEKGYNLEDYEYSYSQKTD